jgi:hypothetical protein
MQYDPIVAVPAHRLPKKRDSKREAGIKVVPNPSSRSNELTTIQVTVGQLFARGVPVGQIARIIHQQLIPHEPDENKRLKKTRSRIRKWLGTTKMRDFIWAEAQILIDLESPAIMRGIAKKAKAGRIDAARLAFELNGRHSPHTEVQPAAINIIFGGVPRPGDDMPALDDPDLVDADDVVEVEDD